MSQPNVLFILVDELRAPVIYESEELQRFRRDHMRVFDTLAYEGVTFDRHYSAATACSPSRTSIYTGQYPSLHGVTNTPGAAKGNVDPAMTWLDPNSLPTMGHFFQAAGYETHWVGKWHASDSDIPIPGTHIAVPTFRDDGTPDHRGVRMYEKSNRLSPYGFSSWIGPEPHGANPLNSGDSAKNAAGRDVYYDAQACSLIRAFASSARRDRGTHESDYGHRGTRESDYGHRGTRESDYDDREREQGKYEENSYRGKDSRNDRGKDVHGDRGAYKTKDVYRDKGARGESSARRSTTKPWFLGVSFVNPHDIAMFGYSENIQDKAGFDYTVNGPVPYRLFHEEPFSLTVGDTLAEKPSVQLSYRDAYKFWFPPPANAENYYRVYYNLQWKVARHVENVLRVLDEEGFAGNTLVVLTSDHGDLLGAHGYMHQKWYNVYEEAIRVPLYMRLPGMIPPGSRVSIPTSHIDLLPTLLGLVGSEYSGKLGGFNAERQLVGRDLRRLIVRGHACGGAFEPIFFMTDDDPVRGDGVDVNFLGLPPVSISGETRDCSAIKQPSHIVAIITLVPASHDRSQAMVWKLAAYYDNTQFWTSTGKEGAYPGGKPEPAEDDVVGVDRVGETRVKCKRTVKGSPEPAEWEMYNISADPLELNNLAWGVGGVGGKGDGKEGGKEGKGEHAEIFEYLRAKLIKEINRKRLVPRVDHHQILSNEELIDLIENSTPAMVTEMTCAE